MFVHSVYFWLKSDRTPEQRGEFREELEALTGIETVQAGYVGSPVDSGRPVVDASFDIAVTVLFADRAGHDAYQVDPKHTAFLERFGDAWDRVLVYDFE